MRWTNKLLVYLRWSLPFLLATLLLPTFAFAQDTTFAPLELRIMTFNIWLGGELVNFGKVVEAIQAADAEVVGLQEAEGNTRRLAEALGWHYASERMQIISRYPLIDPPAGNGVYIYVEPNPGQVIGLANVHLPSSPYGPDGVRDGSTLDEILENERITRLAALEPHLRALPKLVESGIPVLLTGDFNTPSHRDWTQDMTDVRDQVKFPVEWPVTTALEDAGFQDAYRAAYPDPAAQIGITWTPGYPVPRIRPNEVVDRIDMIFVSGEVEVLDTQIVGETGGEDVDIEINPYPSDHRGVVSKVRVTPAIPPLFVAADRRSIAIGDPIVVRYHTSGGEDTDRIIIVPADGNVANDALMSLPPYEASFNGAVTFSSALLTPGEYAAVLVDENGQEVSRNLFWIVEPDAVSTLLTDKTLYEAGEGITITWENAPGYRWDWLGIYTAGESDLYNYWSYVYTQAVVAGTLQLDEAVLGELSPGDYEIRLMRDDGYVVLATTSFAVSG